MRKLKPICIHCGCKETLRNRLIYLKFYNNYYCYDCLLDIIEFGGDDK